MRERSADILSWNDERPVVGFGLDYPDGTVVGAHAHDRAQVLCGLSGIVAVSTGTGAWMMTPEHGLWIPAEVVHAVRMIGAVRMRSLYLRPDALPGMPGDCTVLAMTPLVRSMIAEVTLLPRPPVPQSEVPRDLTLEMLLLHELPRLDAVPLAVPLPATPALRALCEGFVRQPVPRLRIEDWAEELGISRRSFTRRFRAETGLSLAEWRQRASVMAALPRLLAGVPVTEVALDLGYETPAAFGTMFRRVTGESPGRYGAG